MPITIIVKNDHPVFRSKPLDVITVPMNIETNINFTSNIFDFESHDIYMTPWQKDARANLIAP
jgi:hypothetical protein